jgi:murein DD-endopeptidase MepM/ murein hydrolase activator NlpD
MNRIIRLFVVGGVALILFGTPVITSPTAKAVTENFIRPVRGKTILRFGVSYLDATGRARGHHGIDINGSEGTAVTASGSGKVVFAGSTPYGTCVSIIHPGAIKTTYLPLSTRTVRVGDAVKTGQVVGYIGGAADPSGKQSHLHMGAIFAGEYIDPESLFRGEFKPDLSQLIRRANIPPVAGSGYALSPVGGVSVGIPGIISRLWDGAVSFFEWLAGGVKGFFGTITNALTGAWSWLRSIAINTVSYLWGKWVFKFPHKIPMGANGLAGFELMLGTGAGVQVFDPSGDASEPNNRVSFDFSGPPTRVEVFDSNGRSVWVLDPWEIQENEIYWTGTDNSGCIVPNGTYTVIVEYADSVEGFLVEARWHN